MGTEIAGYGGNVTFTGVIGATLMARSWTLDLSGDTPDITDFDDTANWRVFLAALNGWTATVDCVVDNADLVQPADVGVSATLDLFLVDGGNNYTGNAICNSLSATVSVEGEATQTISFQGNGALAISDSS